MAIKVLHVIEGIDQRLGGLPTALFGILELEKKLSVESEVLSVEGEVSNIVPENFHLFTPSFPARFKNSNAAIIWLKQNITNYNYLIFHGIWTLLFYRANKLTIRANVPFYVWPHGSLDPFDLQKKKTLKKILGTLFLNRILLKAECIFCTSSFEKERLTFFGKKTKNIGTLPLPVNYHEGYVGERDTFRNRYGIAQDQFVFLFLSRINYKKGIEELLFALHNLILKNLIPQNNIKLVIAGDDIGNTYADKMKLLVRDLNLSENVIFTGLLTGSSKANAFFGADVFVLPSKNENFGLAIIEALQCSTPVLISKNVYIYNELFNHEFSPGWLCQEDLTDLEEVVFKAYLNTDKFVKNQAQMAGEQYKNSQLAHVYKEFYIK